MNKILGLYILIFFTGSIAIAGNPDRQGESGAGQLIFNPWARSAGLHSMNTSSISGVEAMRLNVAGLSRLLNGELVLTNSRVYDGTGISQTAGGYATKIGGNGALGFSLTSLSVGDINVTTVDQPEGTGGTFTPNLFNLGIGYSYLYGNKISVGLLVRGVSESLPDLNAFGFSIDAGVQYVSGPKDNFRLGISLNNIGSPMKFAGQGLAFQGPNIDPSPGGAEYPLTYFQRSEAFQLPTLLNLGLSYDVYFGEKDYLRILGNFTSNAYARDEVGGGAEFSFRDVFVIRGAYKHTMKQGVVVFENDLYTGFAGGFSVQVPMSKTSKTKFGIDYAYRTTNPFKGTHNVGLRFSF